MKQSQEQIDAIAELREWLKPGDTVFTILRHVSRSGMQREISVVINRDGAMLHPNWSVAKALGYRQGKSDGIIMGGCGMDMGFHLVYNLSRVLFPDGFTCAGRDAAARCPSNDHNNGDRNYAPHAHKDGGYALRREWL
jgi:hypothetical protein